ncbi:helix-turn-helix domain-containing protein [Bacillus pseudomycoides]|uniref:helix-turn-helix domain-containing protein n=1 Tax=Bacillus pseudomycoides TaxID=64104 RepID=UPI000BFBD3FE|nr:helix-turn-helix transcriptional regulator [Bacillus pseudomycoides]PGS09918.1 transcriptional regulator [Bacillus pseudomycoides]PHB23781.1 transcriptional regulator [Bacillus pseudomycoides]
MIEIKLKDEIKTRLLIAKTGKSLRRFSKENGFSHAYLSQILKGDRNPSPVVATKISKGLNLEIEDIFLIKVVGGGNRNGKEIQYGISNNQCRC